MVGRRKQWEREVSQADEKYGPIFAKYAAMSVEQVAQDPAAKWAPVRQLLRHLPWLRRQGLLGFPNLADQHWRWGGDATSIKTSILNGRIAAMPAWGQAIGEEGVKNVAAFVRNELAGLPLPEGTDADLGKGKEVYAQTCAVCHGQGGEGMAALGAPNLQHASGWIYGSSSGQLQQTIRHGRNGQMPAQQQYLGNDKVHLLAAYVYSLSKTRNKSPSSES